MRIDEFKATASGSIIAADRTRFSCFGFDIVSGAAPTPAGEALTAAITALFNQIYFQEED